MQHLPHMETTPIRGTSTLVPRTTSLIRVKHIYNFLLIHASFVMLSHVSIIILHHFYAFFRTNLLTRCPVPVSCFCCFCISEIYFWKYSRNWTKIYGDFLCEGRHQKTKGQPWGPPTGQGRPPAATYPREVGGTRPCSLCVPRPPSTPIKLD